MFFVSEFKFPMFQTLTLCSNHHYSLKFADNNRPISLTTLKSGGRLSSLNCRAILAGVDRVVSRNFVVPMASLYEVLQVSHSASPVEIKTAYRRLAKRYHPDALPSSPSGESDGCDFIEIHNAYQTLSDPAARALYDLSLGVVRRGMMRSSTSFGGAGRFHSGFYRTRRWETDQCW